MVARTHQHLRRIWQSIPLKRLHQGSTLTIRTTRGALPESPSPWNNNQHHHHPTTTTTTTTTTSSHPRNNRIIPFPPTHVVIQPGWRDEGHVEFEQIFDGSIDTNDEASTRGAATELVVIQEPDARTSLGRVACHVSLELRPKFSPETTVRDSSEKPQNVQFTTTTTTTTSSSSTEKSEISYVRSDPKDATAGTETENIGETTKDPGIYINIQVPEKINLVCRLDHNNASPGLLSSITVTDKIEGDVNLSVNHGNIYVKKLRGNTVQLETTGDSTGGGTIHVASLLEAQRVRVETHGRFRAKQIHGRDVDLIVHHSSRNDNKNSKSSSHQQQQQERKTINDEDDEGSLIDVSSLFVSDNGVASVQVRSDDSTPLERRAVRIKSHHGFLAVATKNTRQPLEFNPLTEEQYPLVELGGVNGSCEVTVDDVVTDDNSHQNWTSVLVHIDSLSPESVSFVTADRGDIAMTIDRKAEADLRLLSTSEKLGGLPWTEIGPMLVEDDDHDNLLADLRERVETTTTTSSVNDETGRGRISIQTKTFMGRPSSFTVGSDVSYVDGWVENKSQEPDSRYERKVRGAVGGGSMGKIRLDGAAKQALDSFSSSSVPIESVDGNENDRSAVRPLLAVAGTQKVKVETVSWLGAIARRYGLQEESRKGVLGRTASRRGRLID